MHLSTMHEWLEWIDKVHFTEIELGLDRVKAVAANLSVLTPACPVVMVGGTNGKGSTVAGLEAIYRAAGYHVGAFTSPFLISHNEQVRINGQLARDEEFCAAFEKIETARGEISLTPFEFHTLAALLIFKTYPLNVILLEVGLGGRLDAVNIIDADVSVITSIDLDHMEWLGKTRKAIADEKTGILRAGRPAVCGDANPPELITHDAVMYYQGKDFSYQASSGHWSWQCAAVSYDELPLPKLLLQNISCVLMVVTLLQEKLPVPRDAIDQGIRDLSLPGRIEIVEGPVTLIYDVAHNPAGVTLLATRLKQLACQGETLAVFSMLSDKDIVASIKAINDQIAEWYVAALPVKRAATIEKLKDAFIQAGVKSYTLFDGIEAAYRAAKNNAKDGDRLVIFGSFHTVARIKLLKW